MASVVNEIFTLSIMAFAVGMDAFSVGLGMGMVPLRLKQIFQIGIMVGLFHILMPLLGIITGKILSEQFGRIATYAGGLLLIFIGLQMFYSSFQEEEQTRFKPVGIGVLMFALSVSIDSFSLGLTLGIFGAEMVTAILLFGLFSMCLTWAGLLFGKKIKGLLGNYGEALGGTILLFFGIKLLLP
ncbi:manganese efflux pump MntP family protein [Caldibacillus lycopersici]|uniref:Putative manganese efflux pump MntP n=1 Tax=Perspicuibacillus lycopersici TaxID=1325689 RepID=A0AAE3IRL0_9BACI|nr:manganese efflux pump MntP family protein [Perspicuibacillus lycopersici]MCU9613310.1 manganese efflux pump MntP family protein [Perspicuibacillus lycopersici]